MEENSEVPMETDVSSTTGDAIEAGSVVETLDNIETTIVVENLSEESLNSNSIKLLSDPEAIESIEEVLSPTSVITEVQGNSLIETPESNIIFQVSQSEVSPRDVSENCDEEKSPCLQPKTFNNTHKSLLKLEQLQNTSSSKEKSPLKINHQNTFKVKDIYPLKGDEYQKTFIHKKKTPIKIIQVQKISNEKLKIPFKPGHSNKISIVKDQSPSKSDQLQKVSKEKHTSPFKSDKPQKILNDKEKSPLKSLQPENHCIDKEKSPLQSLQPENHCIDKEKSPLKSLQPENHCIDKEKSPLKSLQPENHCIGKEKSPLKSLQPENHCIGKEKSPLKSLQPENHCIGKEKSPLKSLQPENHCIDKEKSPLKSLQPENHCIDKEKSPLKSLQPENHCIDKMKSPLKSLQPENHCIDKEKSPLKSLQPENHCIGKEKSPLKSLQPENHCFDKEKSPFKNLQPDNHCTDKEKSSKTDQTQENDNIKHNALSTSNEEGDRINFLESTDETNDSSNAVLDSNSENLVEEPLVPPMEALSPDKELPKDQTETSLNESADVTLNDNKMDSKEDEMTESNTLENCEKDDSQSELSSDIEKDHNKNISRELKSLIKSARESKIISECNQVTSKTRKSRSALDNSLNSTVESDKILEVRRSSINSQKSNCSEKSEKAPKRSMRSQNPEFVNKVKQFLNSVTGKFQKGESDDEMEVKKETQNDTVYSPSKKKKHVIPMDVDSTENTNKLRTDPYCWRCHWAVEQVANEKGHPPMQCTVCPRAIHFKCLNSNERNKIAAEKSWVCPECLGVLHAESSETRSPAMKKVSLGLLCELLHHALERMKNLNGVEPFLQPVDRNAFPDYDKYVVHPMDLSLMKDNITDGLYGSTEAFLADAQWILHNSIIFNTLHVPVQSKLPGAARALVRACRAELGEIEACAECYAAAHAGRPTWFTDVCSAPHVLLWAKLKGFPYWPAKGMSVSSAGMVDVRFFGAHDRAWVPARDCFLFCEKDPNNFRSRRQDILDSTQEAEQHIRNISRKYGQFVYPPFKTPFDPTKVIEQLKMMIPTFDGEVGAPVNKPSNSSPSVSKGKSRSNSKSSKSSVNDGDVSESEDVQVSRKMADGAEIARDEDFTVDKNKSMEAVETVKKDTLRKRRGSDLEEAVITIMDNSSKEKRRKIESDNVHIKEEVQKKAPDEKENVEEVNKITEVNEKDKVLSSSDKVVPNNSKPENEPATLATPGKTPKIKPIRISISKDNDKGPMIVKPDKTDGDKGKMGDKHKAQKRRNSRNKSINGQNGKVDKSDTKSDKDNVANSIIKEKNKDAITYKNKALEGEKHEKLNKSNTNSPKSSKNSCNFDDNTTLAVIARDGTKTNVTGLPTISCVRSLSTAQSSDTNTKTIEVTVTAGSNSSIFTPTSTDHVRNMKDVANKLQILRNDKESPLVGRVGVRAFARMTSPERLTKPTENVEIEIKSEPIDFDDADRQVEKIDLMKQFSLRPVNPPNSNLREVRINKVSVAPISRKTVSKPPDVRVKAKKTFPQPRKVDDGRSELNSKNSMVYIPIQPPSSQAPARPARPAAASGAPSSAANSTVNTVTTPLVPVSINSNVQPSFTVVTSASNKSVCVPTVSQPPTTLGPISNVGQTTNIAQMTTVSSVSTVGQLPTLGQMNAIGQVATNVHTVPLITSVNGQWTFSLQPIMSVGGLDETSPLINGLTDRSTAIAPLAALPGVHPLQVPPLSTTCNNQPDNPGEPPRLQQKPLLHPLDARAGAGPAPPPCSAGPVSAKLNQNAVKLTDFFRTLLEDTLDKVDEPAAQATLLKMQLEHTQWRHVQEIRELKHNHELTIMEMRASYEKEKARAVSEARRTAQVELEAAVKATKAKQWCANCSQEAQFYCCWNTSYCDYPCQKAHWNAHYSHCTQQRNTPNNGDAGNSIEKRLQPAPDNLPKSAPAPTLSVGSRLTPTRVFSQDNSSQKTSIIVSMMEDHSGNQTMKCVGTYKPPSSSQVPPLIINKQMTNSEESSKKVVTSGGYLIVGAGSTPLVTPPRRTHTIQYYT